MKKLAIFVLLSISCAVLAQREAPICGTKESCEKNPDCRCYCSRKCDYRDKEENDEPVYVKNDPYKKYCYCNAWDRDAYVERCKTNKKRRK